MPSVRETSPAAGLLANFPHVRLRGGAGLGLPGAKLTAAAEEPRAMAGRA